MEVTYTVQIHDEGDGWLWASVEELPGVFASGQTEPELTEALVEAITMYLSVPGHAARVRVVDIDGAVPELVQRKTRFLVDA